MRRAHIGHPIAHRFVDGFLQRLLARLDRNDFCAQHFHPEHVERLAFAIDCPHVNDALEAEHCSHCRGGNPMLPGAGFSDNACLTHAFSQQDLAYAVVDLVCPSVQQILALQINLRAPQPFR